MIYFLQMKLILRHIVILFLTVSSVSAFLLPNFNSEVAVLVLFTLMLTTSGSCITTINIVTIGLFPTSLSGMTLSMTLVLGRIAIVIGVNVMGFLLEINCQATIYTVGAITTCAALITAFLMPKKAISWKMRWNKGWKTNISSACAWFTRRLHREMKIWALAFTPYFITALYNINLHVVPL